MHVREIAAAGGGNVGRAGEGVLWLLLNFPNSLEGATFLIRRQTFRRGKV